MALKYAIEIRGVTPYMQHRMDDLKLEEWEKSRHMILERPDVNKPDLTRAIFHSHTKGEQFIIPAEHIRQSLIGAGSYVKSKVGGRSKSMKTAVAAMFLIKDDIIIPPFDAVDKRSAVNKNVKARVMVIRPRWDKWSAKFELEIDNDTFTVEQVTDLVKYAGQYVGIGSYRPTNNGMYGRFELASIQQL